jgi:hypothetical protein
MVTETKISLELIASTGYKTWLDFNLHHTGSTGTKGIYTYTYSDGKGEREKIELKIPPNMLDRLSWEEARTWLPMLAISSFSEQQKLMDQGRMRQQLDAYIIETFVRCPNGQIEIRLLKIDASTCESLLKWEAKYSGEFVYVEPTVIKSVEKSEKEEGTNEHGNSTN